MQRPIIRLIFFLLNMFLSACYQQTTIKELILQDFMDVEYIPLETNDEFVTQGKVMAIGAEVILITNWYNDGNLFVFDRNTGKGLRVINRKGQGNEEYIGFAEVVLDETNNEIKEYNERY